MLFAADFRRIAREALRGKWKKVFWLMVFGLAFADMFGLGVIQLTFFVQSKTVLLDGVELTLTHPVGFGWFLWVLSLLFGFLYNVLNVGYYRMSCAVLDGQAPRFADLLPWNLLWKVFVMNLLRSLLIFLGVLLFVIPGFIFTLRYSMADYLLATRPELGPVEALRESRRLMKGNKGRLFCLRMSFIGWALLSGCVTQLPGYLLANPASFAFSLLMVIVSWLVAAPLSAYTTVAVAAFYRDVEHPAAPESERAPFSWGEDAAEAGQSADAQEGSAGESAPEPRPAVNEAAAFDLFSAHGCSRSRLQEAGVLEEYLAYGVDSSVERRWVQDQGNLLMQRFGHDPAALDELLPLIAEYGMDDLLDRALERISRHIRQETLGGDELSGMLGRVLALVISGVFAERESYVQRKRAQIEDMAERLAYSLEKREPDGEWRASLKRIREMCRE